MKKDYIMPVVQDLSTITGQLMLSIGEGSAQEVLVKQRTDEEKLHETSAEWGTLW